MPDRRAGSAAGPGHRCVTRQRQRTHGRVSAEAKVGGSRRASTRSGHSGRSVALDRDSRGRRGSRRNPGSSARPADPSPPRPIAAHSTAPSSAVVPPAVSVRVDLPYPGSAVAEPAHGGPARFARRRARPPIAVPTRPARRHAVAQLAIAARPIAPTRHRPAAPSCRQPSRSESTRRAPAAPSPGRLTAVPLDLPGGASRPPIVVPTRPRSAARRRPTWRSRPGRSRGRSPRPIAAHLDCAQRPVASLPRGPPIELVRGSRSAIRGSGARRSARAEPSADGAAH
jgi:hypothetical protein